MARSTLTRHPRRELGLALAGVALALSSRLLAEVPSVVEWHRRTAFPRVASVLQAIFGTVSGTIGEIVAVALIALALCAVVKWRARAGGGTILAAGIVVAGFYLSWGMAYHYPSLSNRLPALGSLPVESAPPNASLEKAAEQTARLIGTLTVSTPPDQEPDDALIARINNGLSDGLTHIPPEIEAAPVSAIRFGLAKLSRVSFAMSRLQLSGYYFPWTGEAQINAQMPRTLWPRVAGHEKAHQRGFARENEATVIGVLACLESKDRIVRYSGALGLFVSFDRDLATVRSEERARIWALLPRSAVEEFRAEAAFWKRYDGVAGKVSEKVNDTYLKAQGVRSGVQSYSETTRLFLQAMEMPSLSLGRELREVGSPLPQR